MLAQSRYLFLVLLLTLGACATTGGGTGDSTKDTVRASLNQLEVTATAALDLSTDLNDKRVISLAQHKQIGVAARAVFDIVTTGRAILNAGDVGGAQAQILVATAKAVELADFYLNHKGAR